MNCLRRLCLLMAILMLPACSYRLPELQPAAALNLKKTSPDDCRAVFPHGKWQFTHAIEAFFPGGGEKLIMGVTVVDAARRTIACALMTVEGFVLFQAHMDPTLRVERAMPPFDREGFAAGMLADIRLMFLEPADCSVENGRIEGRNGADSEPVCRYTDKKGMVTDVMPGTGTGAGWRIVRYDCRKHPARIVTAGAFNVQAGFPGRVQLVAPGPAGYTLKMKLVDAVRLDN